MTLPSDPRHLAVDLIGRSICSVRVAAVLADRHGIFSWSWNGVGSGFGEHAEAGAIRRANKRRLMGATIYTAAIRQRHRSTVCVTAHPCDACMALLRGYGVRNVMYRNKEGWHGIIV